MEESVACTLKLKVPATVGVPVMVGTSRKSFLATISKEKSASPLGPEERFEGSLATAVWSMACGAAVVRVHDVGATAVAAALLGDSSAPGSGERRLGSVW